MKAQLITLLLAASLASACSIHVDGNGDWDHDSWEARERENRSEIERLVIGMEGDQVLTRLGTPDFSERFIRDGAEYRVLFYRTHRQAGDGVTTKDETTPLVIVDGILMGWGHGYYAQVVDDRL